MDYLCAINLRNSPRVIAGPKPDVRRRSGDGPPKLVPPTGDWWNRAEAKRRREKEAAAGASA